MGLFSSWYGVIHWCHFTHMVQRSFLSYYPAFVCCMFSVFKFSGFLFQINGVKIHVITWGHSFVTLSNGNLLDTPAQTPLGSMDIPYLISCFVRRASQTPLFLLNLTGLYSLRRASLFSSLKLLLRAGNVEILGFHFQTTCGILQITGKTGYCILCLTCAFPVSLTVSKKVNYTIFYTSKACPYKNRKPKITVNHQNTALTALYPLKTL